MLPWSLREVAALTGGRIVKGDAGLVATGVAHDTRNVRKGDLFIAIVGERLDGHQFLRQAKALGAKAAVVSRLVSGVSIPQIKVEDTTKALGALGRSQRLQWNGTVAAVTGSVGKTTVKDMTAHLLTGSLRTLKTEGNLNNQYGLPLTLLRLTKAHEAAVVELGINHPGEMEVLSEIARPDVAVVTAIGEAHLGFFKDRRHLAEEKMRIAASLREGGVRVLNADDRYLKGAGYNVMTFGLKTGQVKAKNLQSSGWGTRFTLEAQGESASTQLNIPGRHNVSNALAAVSTGLVLGISLKTLAKRLSSFVPQAAMRMEIKNLKGVLFLNDAYNASPTSMEAALETFKNLKTSGRKIAVLGDMLEMGAFAKEAHERMVNKALESSFDALVLVGRQMGQAGSAVSEAKKERIWFFNESSHAAAFLKDGLHKGDSVLLKASRGIKLEKVLEGF